jgi:hypothetical protein
MDDFNLNSLTESRNEYCSLLLNKLSPSIYKGIVSIFKDAVKICVDNDEDEKYLLTFQNMLTRVPRWNNEILDTEVERLKNDTNCKYLEDLITCVHVTQLKILSCVRVGNKNKRIDIDIPGLKEFIHKIYIEVARKLYKNVYLFQQDVAGIVKQKNARIAELIIRECIFDVIRNSMPIEELLRAYLDETQEELVEEVVEEREVDEGEDSNEIPTNEVRDEDNVRDEDKVRDEDNVRDEDKVRDEDMTNIASIQTDKPNSITFDNNDHVVDFDKKSKVSEIPHSRSEFVDKSVEELERISMERAERDEETDDEDGSTLKIQDDLNDKDMDLNITSLDEPQPIDLGEMDESQEDGLIRLNF